MATKPRSNETGCPLLTDEEACNHLRIRQRQLYTWRMQGAIPFIRIGRSVRYRLSDLEAAIDALTVVSQPHPHPNHQAPAADGSRSSMRPSAPTNACTTEDNPQQKAGATEMATGSATSGAGACPAKFHSRESR
jgi:excisionase family DNA binding protein